MSTVNGHPAEPARVHVVPVFPCEPEHAPDVACWCEPELTHRNEQGGEVWTHRRLQ